MRTLARRGGPRWNTNDRTTIRAAGALAMLVTYQAVPIPRVAAPDLAASLALQVAQADGCYFAASALSSVVGCLLAGLLAGR